MVRAIVFLALGVVVVLLAWALVRDFKNRRKEQVLSRIRSAFLHGVALAPPARSGPTSEVQWQGLRLAFPASWQIALDDGRLVCRFPLRTEPIVTAICGGPAPPTDASIEYLTERRHLARWVEDCAARALVAFVWCMSDDARTWTFRAELTLEKAHEVTAQADVARLDQAIRSVRLAEEPTES